MIIKTKKGDNRYLTIWNFIVWAMTGAALVIVILLFYSTKIDAREEESKILALKISDCLVDSGVYKDNFESSDFNIFEECGIDEKAIWNGDYYFHVWVYEGDDENKRLIKENASGTGKYEKECELAKTISGDFPSCFEETLVAYNDGKKMEIKILTASNQAGAKL